MNHHTTDDLERELATPGATPLGGPDLDLIHRLGTRRRRGRRAAAVAAAGALTLAVVAGTGLAVDRLGGTEAGVDPVPPAAQPDGLSPLAQRVLDEVPGAVQVSDWQVVIPGPGTAPRWDQRVDPDEIAAGTSTVGSSYTGVTSFGPNAFPAWLYEGVERIEQGELAEEDGSYPVGSTDMGILVEQGEADLACVGPSTQKCTLAMLSVTEEGYTYQYGMGTETFLDPGAPMEVFLNDDYSSGRPSTLAIGGLDGDDVGRVEVVTTDGERSDAVVEAGTWSDGDTIFWANVPGQVARVIAYDASGAVVEDHPIKPCDNPVDCEVR